MRGFLCDVLTALDMEMGQLAGGFKYSVFGDKAVVVEGHCGLNSISADKIKLRLKRKSLCINGQDLSIKQLEGKCAIIVGQIASVVVE